MTTTTENKKLTISSLLTAARQGNIEEIRHSITEHGLPKNGRRTTDYLVLQTAVKNNQRCIVQILIDAGCRINAKDSDSGLPPLTIAVKNDNLEISRLLLAKGADFVIDSRSKCTVLHLAAQQKSFKILQLLLRYGFDVNSISNNITPFQVFFASSYYSKDLIEEGDAEILKLFLNYGAQIDVTSGKTLLPFVVTAKEKDMIKMMIQATSNINEFTDGGSTSLHLLLQESPLKEHDILDIVKSFMVKEAKVDIPDNQGNTVCHIAAKKKYLRVLQLFFQYQWDVNYYNSQGDTVLHSILENSSHFCQDDLYHQIVFLILNVQTFKFTENVTGKFPIHVAIENNQKQLVNEMLSRPGIDVNATDERLGNYTVLHFYLKHLVENIDIPDNLDIENIEKLVSLGAQADIGDGIENRITPMHFGLMLKNKTIMKILLKNFSPDKFELQQEKSLLHYLIHNTDYSSESQELDMIEIAELYIQKGANINFKDFNSRTPLDAAIMYRQKHMTKLLLDNNADIHAEKIIEILMVNELVQLVQYPGSGLSIRRAVIDVSGDIVKVIEILEMLATKGMLLENKSPTGYTIFHYAASKQYTEMILKLLPYLKDPNVRDPNENTILHTVLNSYMNTNYEEEKVLIEVASALLSKGASVVAVNNKGELPLHLSAKNKHLEISQNLLQYGTNPVALDSHGNSVLHFVSMLNFQAQTYVYSKMVSLFIEKGCDVNCKNSEGMTPLLVSVNSGCIQVTRALLQYNAKTDCTLDDEYLSTPLHLAAGSNRCGILKELIKFGADVNAKRKDGKTALHISVSNSETSVTKILLENDADFEMKDDYGRTPLHWACWYNRNENVDELLNYGADINTEDKFQVIPMMLAQHSTHTWTTLYYHAMKMQAAKMTISKTTEKCIAEHEKARQNDSTVIIGSHFFELALEEVSKMKATPIDLVFNLYDILQMKPINLRRFNNNQIVQDIIFDVTFEEKFPVYSDLIKACYRKNIVRQSLLLMAKDALIDIVGLGFEESCYDIIFGQLSNHELRQLVAADKIRSRKRRGGVEDVNELSPKKKFRRDDF